MYINPLIREKDAHACAWGAEVKFVFATSSRRHFIHVFVIREQAILLLREKKKKKKKKAGRKIEGKQFCDEKKSKPIKKLFFKKKKKLTSIIIMIILNTCANSSHRWVGLTTYCQPETSRRPPHATRL